MRYEYTVIPAPSKGDKVKGAKTPTDRYVLAFTAELNRMAAEGWDYVRAETLPSEERTGLTGRSTVYHNLLIFRRTMQASDSKPEPKPAAVPQPESPVGADAPQTPAQPLAPADNPQQQGDTPAEPPRPPQVTNQG